MREITEKRGEFAATKAKTGGSTFKNPEGHSSWKLIDEAGCRGLMVGGAQVSEMHCQLPAQPGRGQCARDRDPGETVRNRVRAGTGIDLKWEIRRMVTSAGPRG